jgi:hypothetical protein
MNRRFLSVLGAAVLMATTLVLMAVAHRAAALTLPVPWNDESWILWKALAFSETGSLFSERLNPERLLITFPAFETLLGLVFRMIPFSLENGRWVSWFFLAASYPGWWVLVRRIGSPWLPMAVISLVYLNATFTVAGNVARPESLLMATSVWSMALLASGRVWAGGCLAAVGVMVHPAGLIFAAAWGGAWLLGTVPRWPRPGRGAWVAMAVTAALAALWLGHLLGNPSEFRLDYGRAAGEELGGSLLDRLLSPGRGPYLALYAGLLVLSAWRWRAALPLILLGITGLAVMVLRAQMWYEVYVHMGFMTLAALLPLAIERTWPPGWNKCAKTITSGVLILPILLFFLRQGFVEGPRGYPHELQWGWGMRVWPREYLAPETTAGLAGAARDRFPGVAPGRVQFIPEADGLFHRAEWEAAGWTVYQPVRTTVRPDWAVLRKSEVLPGWVNDQVISSYWDRYGFSDDDLVYTAPDGDRWYMKRLAPPGDQP